MLLTRRVFNYIEEELHNYEHTKRKLADLREDIIIAAPTPSEGQRSAVSDPTAAKAGRLLSNKTICRMEETLIAIDRALQLVTDDHLTVFDLHYKQGLRWQRVCDKMPTSRSTFFRLRLQLVKMVANQLGYEL